MDLSARTRPRCPSYLAQTSARSSPLSPPFHSSAMEASYPGFIGLMLPSLRRKSSAPRAWRTQHSPFAPPTLRISRSPRRSLRPRTLLPRLRTRMSKSPVSDSRRKGTLSAGSTAAPSSGISPPSERIAVPRGRASPGLKSCQEDRRLSSMAVFFSDDGLYPSLRCLVLSLTKTRRVCAQGCPDPDGRYPELITSCPARHPVRLHRPPCPTGL